MSRTWRTPASAGVLSLATYSTEERIAISTAPRAIPGPAIRPPAVAGKFYPGEAAELTRMVNEMLPGQVTAEPWPAAMVPHAGLIYSGRIAADVLRRIKIPETVIVLGPKHTPHGMEWSVAPQQAWAIPGGIVHSDPELARELTQAIPGLELTEMEGSDRCCGSAGIYNITHPDMSQHLLKEKMQSIAATTSDARTISKTRRRTS